MAELGASPWAGAMAGALITMGEEEKWILPLFLLLYRFCCCCSYCTGFVVVNVTVSPAASVVVSPAIVDVVASASVIAVYVAIVVVATYIVVPVPAVGIVAAAVAPPPLALAIIDSIDPMLAQHFDEFSPIVLSFSSQTPPS